MQPYDTNIYFESKRILKLHSSPGFSRKLPQLSLSPEYIAANRMSRTLPKNSRKKPKMRGHLLFFDNQFSRLLIEKTRNDAHKKWQAYFCEEIFKSYLPHVVLTTPFSYLEMLGIRLNKRALDKFPSKEADDSLSYTELAKILPARYDQAVDEAMKYYSLITELQLNHFRERTKYLFANVISPYPYQQLIAKDIMGLPSRVGGFEKIIWGALALDDIQSVLLRAGDSKFFDLARLQTLRDMLDLFGQKYNYSCFRIMRSIWVSNEASMLNPRFKSAVPLRKLDDLGDVDYVHYAMLGGFHEGKQRTVTVFTCDPYDKVETRLKVAKLVYQVFGVKTLAKSLSRAKGGVPTPRYGRVIVCDPVLPLFKVIKVADLDMEVKYPDDAISEEFIKKAELIRSKNYSEDD